jgi:methylenetetrahydrofolate reductase (NADPH)
MDGLRLQETPSNSPFPPDGGKGEGGKFSRFSAGGGNQEGTNSKADDLRVSFEFFPPKTEKMEARLWETVERLTPFRPDFVSVTYGAGGSTRDRTHATVERIRRATPLEPAAHLTCVGASRAEVDSVARRYREAGIRHVVALRGDVPGGERFVPHREGYTRAAELVAGLKRAADFEVSVACHPEVHPDAASAEADLANLKAKVDAGASRAMTQFFFDVDVYLRFRDRAVAAGVNVPLVPGILPITNYARTCEFAAACGATIPRQVARLFDDLDDDPATRQLVAASVAAEQCRRLQAEGVHEFHFYTLNRAELTAAICRLLGLKPIICDTPSPLGGEGRGEGYRREAAIKCRSPSPQPAPIEGEGARGVA